jgi:hypothetical protein
VGSVRVVDVFPSQPEVDLGESSGEFDDLVELVECENYV